MAVAPKQKQEDKDLANSGLRLEVPSSDFIPYACHYNKDTILTKNGELLQAFKIKGFSYTTGGGGGGNVREQIRKAIFATVKSSQFAICFHTIRHTINLDSVPKFPTFFSQKTHEAWVRINTWNNKHVNSLYVTLIRKGISLNLPTFLKRPSVSLISKMHDEALIEAYKELDGVVSKLLKELATYSPTKLGMEKDQTKGYYSTLLKFFSKIIYSEKSVFPVTAQDLSRSLTINKIAFGYNALEIKKKSGSSFATLFSIKTNNEVDSIALGKFLQMPQQMVVTQTINFIDHKRGTDDLKYQDYLLGVSKDSEFKRKSGLDEAKEIAANSQNSFCTVQTTVMIVADDLDRLKYESLQTYLTLSSLGLPAIKEDLNMEHCFWAQLPANFAYIARKAISLSAKMGNFALLSNLPFGELQSKWGEPITLFSTTLNTPYFFNFHTGEDGHTLIVGDDAREKAVTLNFLLSEASKFNTKFIYLDSNKKAKLYIRALGVEYLSFSFDEKINKLRMNPLLLEDNKANKMFLKNWFVFLLNGYTDLSIAKRYLPAISKAVDVLFSLPKEKRKLCNTKDFFSDETTKELNNEIINKLQPWIKKGKLSHIFDNDADHLMEKNGSNLAINISAIYDTSMGFNLPVLTYILHFFKENFTGSTPSILCVAEANRVFNSIFFEKNLEYILDDFTAKNAIALLSASFCSESVNWSEKIAKLYNKKIKTQIFMADSVPSHNNVVKLFNLNQQERMYLQSLAAKTRQFLLRQNNISIILKIDLERCATELGILAGDPKAIEVVNNLIKETGDDSKDWLPKLYEKQSLSTE